MIASLTSGAPQIRSPHGPQTGVELRMFTLLNREKSDRLGKLLVSCRGRSKPMFGLLLADVSAMAFDLL
jgi:small ligand-binding sensory domain FIST